MKKLLLGSLLSLGILTTNLFAFGHFRFYNHQNHNFNTARYNTSITTLSNLTQEQIEGLKHMVQEEKLARDVYITLYNKWHSRVFLNISKSEQRHMNAIKTLLRKYGIEDPTLNKGIGEFEDPNMYSLYQALVEKGLESQQAAYEVGKQIEELDIKDLDEELKKFPENSDVAFVYNRLKNGSYHHLSAFNYQLGIASRTVVTR